MTRIANILIALIAALHIYILILEMFLWQTRGAASFGLTAEFAAASADMAANQGLYNGFLAAGLIWGLLKGREGLGIKTFFLSCIIIAGVFGAVTVSPKIALIQTVPASLALFALWVGRKA